MFFPFFVLPPTPNPLPTPITCVEIHRNYDSQLLECPECVPMVQKGPNQFKRMKHRAFLKYLEHRAKLYAKEGMQM